jgi:hypothetical protein
MLCVSTQINLHVKYNVPVKKGFLRKGFNFYSQWVCMVITLPFFLKEKVEIVVFFEP